MEKIGIIENKIPVFRTLASLFSSSNRDADEKDIQDRIDEIRRVQDSSYIEKLTQDYERHEIGEKPTRKKENKTVQEIRSEQVVNRKVNIKEQQQEDMEQEL